MESKKWGLVEGLRSLGSCLQKGYCGIPTSSLSLVPSNEMSTLFLTLHAATGSKQWNQSVWNLNLQNCDLSQVFVTGTEDNVSTESNSIAGTLH